MGCDHPSGACAEGRAATAPIKARPASPSPKCAISSCCRSWRGAANGQRLPRRRRSSSATAVPAKPKAVAAGDATLIWSGPDQFLALAPRKAGSPLLDNSAKSLAGMASISDQSDGRALIRIAGPKARDVLAKFCSLDLDPSEFPVGTAAATSVDHTAVTLWRGKDDGRRAGLQPAGLHQLRRKPLAHDARCRRGVWRRDRRSLIRGVMLAPMRPAARRAISLRRGRPRKPFLEPEGTPPSLRENAPCIGSFCSSPACSRSPGPWG